MIQKIELILKGSTEAMPIVSSLIGQPYDENHFEKIVNALKSVSTENVKSVYENGLWLKELNIDKIIFSERWRKIFLL